jgi:hypothetical protein
MALSRKSSFYGTAYLLRDPLSRAQRSFAAAHKNSAVIRAAIAMVLNEIVRRAQLS